MPKPSRKGISAAKRLRQSLKRRDMNRSIKSKTRTLMGKAITFIGADVGSAEEAVREAISGLDRAAQKGVIHLNAAARGKSRLLKRFNLAQASAVAAEATAAPARRASTPAATAEKAPEAPVRRRTGILSRAPKVKADEVAAKKPAARAAPKAKATTKATKSATSEAKPARSRATKKS